MATKLTATSVKKNPKKKKQLSCSTAACIIILVASCATRTSRRWHTCSRPTPSRVRYGTRPWLGCGFPASLPTVQGSHVQRSRLRAAADPLDALETEERHAQPSTSSLGSRRKLCSGLGPAPLVSGSCCHPSGMCIYVSVSSHV
jgi:hypothetical protein